jgi:hypothetical protein
LGHRGHGSLGDQEINRLVENDRLLDRAELLAIAGELLGELVRASGRERIASR